jgi:transmembrane sensor
MQKSNFDRLLQRYLNDQVSEQERIKIEAWLEEIKTEDNTSLELTRQDEEKIFKRITNTIENEEHVVASPSRSVMLHPWAIGIAAALVILAVSFALYRSSLTGVEKTILNDGTLVWLKGDSKIVYYEKPSAGTRHAELTGAALFEVTKDASRPFIVKCGEFTIRVLGTSFSVKPLPTGLELEVLTGKVNLSSPTDSIGVDVESNHKVIYSGLGSVVRAELKSADVTLATESTEYNMRFEGASLKDVFERIEKKFDVTIEIAKGEIGRCKITADFTDHSLKSTLMMISEVLAIEYEVRDKIVLVSGNGCK